ncbi:MAG: alpha/beta fold hydrolase, partial [Candidatus Promineifilaceae bacterium]
MSLKIFEYGTVGQPTILFLHGLGVSSWMWLEQLESLQEQYHLLAVDLPGNGESYQNEWVSFADTAVTLSQIIQTRASNGQAHVVGLSLGGYTALTLLNNHPELVLSTLVSGVTIRPFP